MTTSIIRVENLSKKYRLGQVHKNLLSERLGDGVRRLLGKKPEPVSSDEFWALRDVSFEVNRGDVVGIIGRNGAGKSTLLKILSRITTPTMGNVEMYGRVASLLEVGTGFHPELTGRENIFLNGAILGMSKAEIRSKLDEIIAFAEIEKFIETPVKRYSSGMYVRLAFAVAAHLEPEILIVDEVLAVGDAQFQKKCMGKMEDVGKEGRTVLFVSHNMAAVRQLCGKGIVLSQGNIIYEGSQELAISCYMNSASSQNSEMNRVYNHIKGDGSVVITRLYIGAHADVEHIVSVFEKVEICIDFVVNNINQEIEFFVLISNFDGDILTSIFQRDNASYFVPQASCGKVILSFINNLPPGKYNVSAGIFNKDRKFVDWVEHVESFIVESAFHDGRIFDHRLGKTTIHGEWTSTDEKSVKTIQALA